MNRLKPSSNLLTRFFRRKSKPENPVPFLGKLRKSQLTAFHQSLFHHLLRLDSGVELLDETFPILGGESHIDLVACNNLGELILIWHPSKLKPDFLLKLLKSYDWIHKNRLLWLHLFPQVERHGVFRFKVWIFSQEIDGQIQSVLSYLKGIQLRLFHYQALKKGNDFILFIQPWNLESSGLNLEPMVSPAPPKKSKEEVRQTAESFVPLNLRSLSPATSRKAKTSSPSAKTESFLPPITPEEIQELVQFEEEGSIREEDDLTDPGVGLAVE